MTTRLSLHALAAAATAVLLAGCGASRHADVTRRPGAVTPVSMARLRPPLAPDRLYRQAVEAGVARRLHTPLTEIESQLRSAPGSTLMDLAKPLGFAQDQLGAVVLASLDDAADAAVRSGRWTPAGAREERRYWTAQPAPSLIAEISRWLVNA